MKCRPFIPSVLALVAILPGCGRDTPSPVVQAIVDQPNCLASQDRLWSTLYREIDTRGELPSTESIEKEVRSLARSGAQSEALVSAYVTVAREVRFLPRAEAMVRLAEMEIGDRTTEEKKTRQDEVDARFARAVSASVEVLGACPAPSPPPVVPAPPGVPSALAPALSGAYKAISVGYQSCNLVDLPPLRSATAAIEGVTIVGKHSSGVGFLREVTDTAAVFRTNPFYSSRVAPAAGCFPATSTPLIYDYGGKPYASTSAGGQIDFFRDAGTGSDALGVDCSGFVTTAVLAGGLRLKQNVTSKAPQSGGVSASMFSNPSENGLTCFSRLASRKDQSLRPGDIIANSGHVVMVDQVGVDPLGIGNAKTATDCAAIAASRFDFTIIQSSPSKGGIGMNRYRAADYFMGTISLRAGMEAYAKSFCRVRLGIDPETTLARSDLAVIIRHNGGAACIDTPITLAGEQCLKSCERI